MKKLSLMVSALLFGYMNLNAQKTSCVDRNGYVDSKNSGPIGSYMLEEDVEEKAAQTYYYNGPGKINGVRVHGSYPSFGGAPLRISVYDVDVNGRPTTLIGSPANDIFWWSDNDEGYIDVNFGGGGIFVDGNFAITVELRNASPWGEAFLLNYTGDGEGNGEDLASLAGTSTGMNWTSAMDNFSKDGDFYLEPKMTHFITSDFSSSTTCAQIGVPVAFTNDAMMTIDRMFNIITESGYVPGEYLYTWNFGDGSPVSHTQNPTHSFSAAGVYTVSLTATVEGWNGVCSATYTQQISVGLNNSAVSTPATCFGAENGIITASATGGATPYSYSLEEPTFLSSNVFSGLPAGTYTVMVVDDLGCKDETTVTITEPSEIIISNVSSTNSSCGTSNGSILVTASGGVGTLQYQLNSGSYQSSNSFTGLASGFYTINVKDANNCITTTQKIVSDQGAPTLMVISQTNISCYNGNDGTIVLLGSGGSGTLQYSINGGATYQTNNSFLNLSASAYYAMIKDASGCTYGFRITLEEPEEISFSLASTSVSCFGGENGTITVNSQTGGTGTFSYSTNGTTYQSDNEFTGLGAGSYVVYVKDIAGCMDQASISISQPTALSATAQTTPADCNGSFEGTITINATGGTASYFYSLNDEDYQFDNSFSGLEAGSYTVIISDENGCEFEIAATVTQPTSVLASITTGNSTCGNSNGTMLVVGTGGSGSGYQYSLDGTNFSSSGTFSSLPSGGYYVIIRDGNGCTNVYHAIINDSDGPTFTSVSNTDVACNDGEDGSITVNSVSGGTGTLQYSINATIWQTTTTFSNLQAGTYNLLVKDANGCIGESTIQINEPNAFSISALTSDAICHASNTGSVTINAAGGAGTLAYSINGGFTFTSSNIFNNLSAGNYTVIVRDAAGCTGQVSFTIDEPTPILVFTSVLNISCNGAADGTIYANAIGGTGTLLFSIDGINFQSGNSFSIDEGGLYTVYAKDANGCIETVQIYINEPSALTLNYDVTDVSCAGGNNGVIDITVSGGVAPYSYEWDDFTTNEDIFNLASGSYNVIATDQNGCTIGAFMSVTEPTNPLIVNGTITNTFSQVSADGEIDVTVTGGTSPYDFDWSTGDVTEDITNLSPGVYTVMITDDNGCSASGTFVVSVATGITSVEAEMEVQLFPNPATNYFTVKAGANTIQSVEILNMIGQVVVSVTSTNNTVQMSTGDLDNGMYMVRILINNQTVIKRIEVVR